MCQNLFLLTHRSLTFIFAVSSLLLACCTTAEDASPTQAEKPEAKQVELPGIKIDAKNKFVDVNAVVVLEDGLLEVIACTKDTREHESIVAIEAVPQHIHAALLLIGAENGHPAMVKPANEEKTEWLHLPPRGDQIAVSLIIPDPDNKEKTIERPISDFIKRTENDAADRADAKEDRAEVFDTFVFAGSVLRETKDGKRHYVADVNGNVVSISTFGDEVLCLPAKISQDNASLVWSVDNTHLPKKGTKIKLRLALKEEPKKDKE